MANPEISHRIEEWLKGPIDSQTKKEILYLQKEDPKALYDAFSVGLSFGTGGMRSLMGPGTNRLNRYTVQFATQGLANYILKQKKDTPSVFISYDCRHHSKEFALEAAKVLAGNGIVAHITKELRPTPFVSFGVKHLTCTAGIMITASHNPKEYNGYKVYWSDGGQVLPPHDAGIVQEIGKLTGFSSIKLAPETSSLIEIVSDAVDLAYFEAIAPLEQWNLFPHEGSLLHITYTPLHGTGLTLLPEALKRFGFSNLSLVKAQTTFDGDFPTVSSPNPENIEALSLGMAQIEKENSDLLIASDPDADRMAVVCRHKGKSIPLNGNQIATICTKYLCQILQKKGQSLSDKGILTTIVSTDLLPLLCQKLGAACFSFLTGFKYIGQQMNLWEKNPKAPFSFLFGAEESYGFLVGNHSHDKDSTAAASLICMIALALKKEGKTLVSFLEEIYTTFGFFFEEQHTLSFPPTKEGEKKIASLMEKLRSHPPKDILGIPIIEMEDYLSSTKRQIKTNHSSSLSLPKSNVLLFRLDDRTKIVVRPSGTEPKLKIYVGLYFPHYTKEFGSFEKAMEAGQIRFETFLHALLKQLS